MQRQFDDVLLGSIELFCLAAEAGSFTAAANQAGVTPAAVSRSVARLEQRLGVRLFVRSTRSIRLTEGGLAYFEECRTALSLLAEAERKVSGAQSQPSGTLRISVPTTYGHYRLLPMLPAFRAQYPLIKLDIQVSNQNVDLHEARFDFAIRFRAQPESRMVARHLEDAALVVVAHPDYLRRAGTPKTLEDLADHECIEFDLPSTGRPIPWLFRDAGNDVEHLAHGNFRCADDVLGGVTLAKAGGGLFQTYRFIVEEDLAAGRLVEVLADHAGRSRPVSLMFPHGKTLPSRARVFVDFLMQTLAHPSELRKSVVRAPAIPDDAGPD